MIEHNNLDPKSLKAEYRKFKLYGAVASSSGGLFALTIFYILLLIAHYQPETLFRANPHLVFQFIVSAYVLTTCTILLCWWPKKQWSNILSRAESVWAGAIIGGSAGVIYWLGIIAHLLKNGSSSSLYSLNIIDVCLYAPIPIGILGGIISGMLYETFKKKDLSARLVGLLSGATVGSIVMIMQFVKSDPWIPDSDSIRYLFDLVTPNRFIPNMVLFITSIGTFLGMLSGATIGFLFYVFRTVTGSTKSKEILA